MVKELKTQEQFCQVIMKNGVPCSRQLYDHEHCVFHSSQATKATFSEEFWNYWREIAERNSGDEKYHLLDCTSFVFPEDFSINKGICFGNISFDNAIFLGNIAFEYITFIGCLSMDHVTFMHDISFIEVRFMSFAFIHDIISAVSIIFDGCTFNEYIDVNKLYDDSAIIHVNRMCFMYVHFNNKVRFKPVFLPISTIIESCTFESDVIINGELLNIDSRENIVNFRKNMFNNNCSVVFNNIDLGYWSFSRCKSIDRFEFINVSWKGSGVFKHNHTRDELLAKRIIQEEDEDNEYHVMIDNAENVYRYLRINYEKHLDFETAGGFHIGQMELLKLKYSKYSKIRDSYGKKVKNPNRNLMKRMLLGLYKLTSYYGESLVRPIVTLLVVWLIFSLGWYICGFSCDGVKYMPSYESIQNNNNVDIGLCRTLEYTFGVFISLNVEYNNHIGMIIASMQKIIGIIIVSLFIIAIRRNFRRYGTD